MKIISKLKNIFCPRLKDGGKPAAKIMLYGFFGHNLGDDLFFDMIIRRYPDTLFYVLTFPDYEGFFAKYNNVRYYCETRPMIGRINRLGRKFGNEMLFETILLKICDAAVHIGGSVYQQTGNWQNDLKIRRKRSRISKHFFGISNNFGPYTSLEYKEFWEKDFKKFDNVTFRDKYSYELFSDLTNISYAPDLLFSHKGNGTRQIEKTAAISVINPRLEIRHIPKAIAEGYISALCGLTENLAKSGYTVNLLGFCNLENDTETINEIYEKVGVGYPENVFAYPYTNDFSDTVRIIESSEYILASRFHASVLGFAFNKKVLPVCYSEKTTNMLSDLNINEFLKLESFSDLNADKLTEMLLQKNPVDLGDIARKSLGQFAALDGYIKKRNGKINA